MAARVEVEQRKPQLFATLHFIYKGIARFFQSFSDRNFGSIGVVVGAFSAVAPHRAPEIAQLGLRALAAATLSNLMSATIAGFFIGLA